MRLSTFLRLHNYMTARNVIILLFNQQNNISKFRYLPTLVSQMFINCGLYFKKKRRNIYIVTCKKHEALKRLKRFPRYKRS